MDVLRDVLPHDDIDECERDDVVEAAKNADVLIPTIAKIPEQAFASKRLKLVQQYGVGLDCIDIPAATRAQLLVANVPSAGTGNAESVAELALLHMLMLARDIPAASGNFQARRVGAPMGEALLGKCVVILGYGGIGVEIARRLQGFGMQVIGVSRRGPQPGEPDLGAEHLTEARLPDILPRADYLMVAAPATPENIGLVDESMLTQTKAGAFVINVARGPVIDYDALLMSLQNGHIKGAGLDVFWQEPFDPADPLLKENVIATPHIAGVTHASLRGIGEAVAENVELLRQGKLPLSCANPQAGLSRV